MTRRIELPAGPLTRRADVSIGNGYDSSSPPSTGARNYDQGYRDPELDAMRAAWSGGAPPVEYLDDGAPYYFRTAVRFTGPGRLTTTNPRHPWHVTPGDIISAYEPVAEGLQASPTGYLFIGATLHHTDGELEERTLWSATAALLADPGYNAWNDTLIPDDVDGVTLWAETTGAGWALNSISAAFESTLVEASTITIRRGRTSDDDAPTAASLSATLAMPTAVPVAPEGSLDLSALPTSLYTDPDDEALAATRFRGQVATIDASVTHDGPNTLPVLAASALSALSVKVGDTPWPAEDAVTRAARILELVLGELPEGQPASGGLLVAARDVDSQPAISLLAELVASSPGCRLVELRDGTIRFLPPPPRDTAPRLTLTADVIVEPVSLTQTWAPPVLLLEYGTTDARVVTPFAPDYEYVQGEDIRPVRELSTVLGSAEAAQLAGLTLYANSTVPRWRVPDVTVDVLKLLKRARPADLELVRALLLAEVGDLVDLGTLPLSVPRLGSGLKVLEGWSETLARDAWTFGLYLSDATASLEPLAWPDVDPDLTWPDVDPSLTWLTAAAETTL